MISIDFLMVPNEKINNILSIDNYGVIDLYVSKIKYCNYIFKNIYLNIIFLFIYLKFINISKLRLN